MADYRKHRATPGQAIRCRDARHQDRNPYAHGFGIARVVTLVRTTLRPMIGRRNRSRRKVFS